MTEIGDVINDMVALRLRRHHETMEAAEFLALKIGCGYRVTITTLRTDVQLDPDLPLGEIIEEWDSAITGENERE